MKIETVVPTWTWLKGSSFQRDAFMALIEHYESVEWGFYGVDVFSARARSMDMMAIGINRMFLIMLGRKIRNALAARATAARIVISHQY
jgi:hypothetical protein